MIKSVTSSEGSKSTYVIVLIHCSHPFLALKLCENLSGILHNNLIRLEGAVAANAVATVLGLDDLDSDVILASSLGPVLESLEVSVPTLWTQPAVAVVTLVEHVAILAVLVTASILLTHASRKLELLVRFPKTSGVTNKNI
jgi:hypothetical protein